MTAAVGLPLGPQAPGPSSTGSAPSEAGARFAGVLQQVTARPGTTGQDDAPRNTAPQDTGRREGTTRTADDQPGDVVGDDHTDLAADRAADQDDDQDDDRGGTTSPAGLPGGGVPPWLQLALRAATPTTIGTVIPDGTAPAAAGAVGVVGTAVTVLPGPTPAQALVEAPTGTPAAPAGPAAPTAPGTVPTSPVGAPATPSVPTAAAPAAQAPRAEAASVTGQAATPTTRADGPAVGAVGAVPPPATTATATAPATAVPAVDPAGPGTAGAPVVAAPVAAGPVAAGSQHGPGPGSDDGVRTPTPAPVTTTGAPGAHAPDSPDAPVALDPGAARVEDLPDASDGTQPLPTAPPVPAPTAAPPAAPAAATGPADPPVAAQLAPQLTALTTNDGSHSVTMVLAPESLGEVHVTVTVTGDQVALTLASGHEHGRHALAEALPELRRELAAAGLTVTDADVSAGTSDSGSAGTQPGAGWAQQEGSGARSGPTGAWSQVPTARGTADEDGDTTLLVRHTSTGPTSRGVDVRV